MHREKTMEVIRRKIKVWRIENDLTYGSFCPQRKYYSTRNGKKKKTFTNTKGKEEKTIIRN